MPLFIGVCSGSTAFFPTNGTFAPEKTLCCATHVSPRVDWIQPLHLRQFTEPAFTCFAFKVRIPHVSPGFGLVASHNQ
jgi:hypothetical protein